jgi:hypothetical protein
MTHIKKVLIGVALLLALGVGALTGLSVTALPSDSGVPVVQASGCDGIPPPPEPDCPPTPTPTPKR